MKQLVTTLFIFLLCMTTVQAQYANDKIKAGQEAPELAFPTPAGDTIKLSDIYKNRYVLIDFWASWCGPCRSGMEKMKPLKEELKDEDIEFVYITNQTSPTDTWNMLVPDIKGEHYRVSDDEWNHFSSRFNISGIPHYVLVNKDGVVVDEKVYFASSNEQLKKLFSEHLEN